MENILMNKELELELAKEQINQMLINNHDDLPPIDYEEEAKMEEVDFENDPYAELRARKPKAPKKATATKQAAMPKKAVP